MGVWALTHAESLFLLLIPATNHEPIVSSVFDQARKNSKVRVRVHFSEYRDVRGRGRMIWE